MTNIIKPQGFKGGLYLGSQEAARDIELLNKHRITFVLTVASEITITFSQPIRHLQIHIQDTPKTNIVQQLPKCFQFIDSGISKSNVLVHCKLGVSRSASVVIAYLMRQMKVPYEVAYGRVKNKRYAIRPNNGFVEQLSKYQGRREV